MDWQPLAHACLAEDVGARQDDGAFGAGWYGDGVQLRLTEGTLATVRRYGFQVGEWWLHEELA